MCSGFFKMYTIFPCVEKVLYSPRDLLMVEFHELNFWNCRLDVGSTRGGPYHSRTPAQILLAISDAQQLLRGNKTGETGALRRMIE